MKVFRIKFDAELYEKEYPKQTITKELTADVVGDTMEQALQKGRNHIVSHKYGNLYVKKVDPKDCSLVSEVDIRKEGCKMNGEDKNYCIDCVTAMFEKKVYHIKFKGFEIGVIACEKHTVYLKSLIERELKREGGEEENA